MSAVPRRRMLLLALLALGCVQEQPEFPGAAPALPVTIDSLTYQPVLEPPDDFPPGRFPFAEQWTPECRALVVTALRPGGAVRMPSLIHRSEPSSSWRERGLPCVSVLFYELLVDESGSVACARILSITNEAPPEGLYDEVRQNLRTWRFAPATLDGRPVPVRLSVTANVRCSR